MVRPQVVLAILALALASGCSRGKFVTEIKAGGAWQRTDTLTGKAQKEGMQSPVLEDTFVLPAGPEWKKREDKKDDDRIVILDRAMASGALLKGDVSLKGDGPDQLALVNQVSVKKLGATQFEYREILHGSGKPDLTMTAVKPEDLAKVRAVLPKALATDENARGIMERAAKQMVPMLFGPGEPLIALGMLHPDLAERRIYHLASASLDKALAEQFGEKMTAAERHQTVSRMIEVQLNASKPSAPDPTAGPPAPGSKSSSGLTPLIFIVHGPGRLVSTNGEHDDFSGEVYWALYPEAAMFNDIVMTAVYDTASK